MKRFLLITIIFCMIFANSTSFASIGYENKSKAYLLADFDTGEILASYNVDEQLEIASISKLLSYYVAMDAVKEGRVSLSDKVVIGEDAVQLTGSSYKLKVGELITLDKLMKASIIISGNDATYAMAKHIAGTETKFVDLMKAKAKELNLSNVDLYNSSGLPLTNNGIQNKMTTRDVYKIARGLLKTHPEVLEISRIPFISEPSRKFFEMNTNPLLKVVEEVSGLKTGSTLKAGYCFVSSVNIKGQPRRTEDLRLIGIVMGSRNYEDRLQVSKALVDYGRENYSNKIILHNELPIEKLEFSNGNPKSIDLYPVKGFTKLVSKDSDVKVNIDLVEATLPLKNNTNLGKVRVYENGVEVFSTSLINKRGVEEADLVTKVLQFYGTLYKNAEAIYKID
ncbi:D-alanyl-D-alanine carboxypeptidase [Tissierella creatinini]|nr:D-alanyl-D-alanine carboxypeptidase [Tissierella creatinini]TJX62534.1 D-alanyl-D-alanine carboxypeptidase [Soehngenia saccharolytica]